MATNKPRGHVVRSARAAQKSDQRAIRYTNNFNQAMNRWLAESVLHEYDEGDEKARQDWRYKLLTKERKADHE